MTAAKATGQVGSMDKLTSDLKKVVESQHGGVATFLQTVSLLTRRNYTSDWDGMVYVFELTGNPKTTRAYAWASPISGTNELRYFAALHRGRITGPMEAVKAAAAAIRSAASNRGATAKSA
jgi:hypothetical protein